MSVFSREVQRFITNLLNDCNRFLLRFWDNYQRAIHLFKNFILYFKIFPAENVSESKNPFGIFVKTFF